ncbi:MAG: class I mannose-6-phosphate isomerase [Clostridia bacterium]|nr:class I mannose-6-phosphate isomerase [Clostridia bacterium]
MYPLLLKNYTGAQAPEISAQAADYADAQAFLLSGREDSESVVKNGAFSGLGLNEVLPKICKDRDFSLTGFPLTVKLINTRERLPVKVYPDDEYASSHGGNCGKISLLYIIDCKKDAETVYGLSRNVSPEELKTRVQNGSLSAICKFVNCKKGDVFFIPPGVVFAVGGGISALEISSNSDSEYIISDYGRIGADGKPRPLQINRALDVMKTRKNNLPYGQGGDMTLYPFGTVRELGSSDVFKTELITMDGNMGLYDEEKLISLVMLSGELIISYPSGNMSVRAGDSLLIPPKIRTKLSGRGEVIYTEI